MSDESPPAAGRADAAGADDPPRPGLPGRVWIPLLGLALAALLLAVALSGRT